jgi:hypothetical protein
MADKDQLMLEKTLEELGARSRSRRQDAAHLIAVVSQEHPDLLLSHVDTLVAALDVPEAQTRRDVLSALDALATLKPDLVNGMLDGVETALFDEGSSTVRLAAFKLLAHYGETSPEASRQVWPLLDEAIQCFHGDPEFREMLQALLGFVKSDGVDPSVKQALAKRLEFDAEGLSSGFIKRYSHQIIEAVNG